MSLRGGWKQFQHHNYAKPSVPGIIVWLYTTLAWEFKGATRCLTCIYCQGNIMGKRFANDFDTQPVQRINVL